jgi:LysM repeat protein
MARFSSAPTPGNDDRSDRLIPFPGRASGSDAARPAAAPRRRARRRRHNTSWLQRNALSIAAVSILVALLGMGFGIVQVITRPEPSQALLAVPTESSATVTAASLVVEGPALGTLPTPAANVRPIQSSARVLQPNYTVVAGDTLGRIAAQFGTSVDRIQALNNLADPRSLRIGQKLVIPPAL